MSKIKYLVYFNEIFLARVDTLAEAKNLIKNLGVSATYKRAILID